MSDIDTALRTLVNDAVDDALGPQTAPPPFRARQRSLPRRTWVTPLLAVASVVVVGGAVTTVALAWQGSGRDRVPVRHTPAPAPAPKISFRSLGGARIAVPPHWTVRPYSAYLAPQDGLAPAIGQSWCLGPASLPPSTKPRACPVQLSTVRPQRGEQTIDADIEEGLIGNPEYCSQGRHIGTHSEQWGTRRFGGRDAQWRQVDIRCTTGGGGARFEQYVVDSLPSYIVYAGSDSPAVHAALTTIARYSTLPPQTSRYRLSDLGVIVTTTSGHAGATVVIDRRVLRTDTFTYVAAGGRASYVVPAKVLAQAGKLRRGTLVQVVTDGASVSQIFGVR